MSQPAHPPHPVRSPLDGGRVRRRAGVCGVALAAAMTAMSALATTARAQWTVTNLEPDAGPQLESQAFGVSATQQVGVAGSSAAIWSGTAASWVSINPDGSGFSQLNGVSGSQQVG